MILPLIENALTVIEAEMKRKRSKETHSEAMEHDKRFQNMVRMWGRKEAIEKYNAFVLGNE